MDKRKLSLLLKRKIKKIENKDIYDYLDGYATDKSDLSLHTKIQISNLERSLIDIRDLKKLLNHLSNISGYCVFLVSKNHLFYSGSDLTSDFSTYNKLNLFRYSLKEIETKKLYNLIIQRDKIHDYTIKISPDFDTFQVEDSILASIKLKKSNLYLGILGPLEADFDKSISIVDYLYNSEIFNERISRIFH